jgi:hypothetical protein
MFTHHTHKYSLYEESSHFGTFVHISRSSYFLPVLSLPTAAEQALEVAAAFYDGLDAAGTQLAHVHDDYEQVSLLPPHLRVVKCAQPTNQCDVITSSTP